MEKTEGFPVKIISIRKLTHDVLQIRVTKPEGYNFEPGQATDVSINKPGWKKEKRPFTFTCLPDADYLEFTTKTYPERRGVTNQLLKLTVRDGLILHEVFGAISYKREGVFIAGGAGVTPFIAIFRYLAREGKIGDNMLIFANKTKRDIILETEFKHLLGGEAFINILAEEKVKGYYHGLITKEFLKSVISNFKQQFYVCGPPPFMDVVLAQLKSLGVGKNALTVEI